MNRGLTALREKVIDHDLCTACGACLSLCPYLRSWKGRVVKLDDCTLEEGRCFAFCPRTDVDLDEVHRKIFGTGSKVIEIGTVRNIVMARAKDPFWRKKAQTGGVVSALVDVALQGGRIQSAILSARDGSLLPQGRIVMRREEIPSCAGSSYVSGPTLEALHRGPWKGEERIGVVGLPCQLLALAKMRASTLASSTPIERVDLVIGLFCTWALDHKPFADFLRERIGGDSYTKMNITPPPERMLEVNTKGKMHRIPVEDIRPFVRPGCRVCLDMTAELSDISVGTVEGKKGWNTVIARTAQGEDLLGKAEEQGTIETRPLSDDKQSHLREASFQKKRQALELLRSRGGLEKGYLALSRNWIERILSAAEEKIP